jgi:hypothetical protein
MRSETPDQCPRHRSMIVSTAFDEGYRPRQRGAITGAQSAG